MRIAITVDPYLPVPPRFYGGIERAVDLLVCGLAARGHEVTIFAHPDSRTAATLRPYGAPPHVTRGARARELVQVGGGLWSLRRSVELVHSFGRLAALLPVLPLRCLPKIQSYQRPIPWAGVRRAAWLARGSLVLTGCSTSMYAARPARDRAAEWRTVFNPVDMTRYTPVAEVPADAPLVFLGRLERIKGPQHAVAIARRAGRRLVIAGNIVPASTDPGFYEREIAPHVDGDAVQYVGPVDDERKNRLLGSAAALLMPIEWDEPFGIVMAEALACGTPVVGFPRGSVPEVIVHGMNGFHCRSVDEAAAAVAALGRIDRAAVRADAERRFGQHAIVTEYERLYEELVA